MGRIWNEPKDGQELIDQLVPKKGSVFEFERELEPASRQENNSREDPTAIQTAPNPAREVFPFNKHPIGELLEVRL